MASVPFTLWAVARVLGPDFFELPAGRLKTAAVSIIVLVGLTGFLVGQFNYDFTTCHDYVIAGDDEPANCRNVPTPPPTTSPPRSTSPAPEPSETQ